LIYEPFSASGRRRYLPSLATALRFLCLRRFDGHCTLLQRVGNLSDLDASWLLGFSVLRRYTETTLALPLPKLPRVGALGRSSQICDAARRTSRKIILSRLNMARSFLSPRLSRASRARSDILHYGEQGSSSSPSISINDLRIPFCIHCFT